jgi:hypothetical protein
LMWVEVLCENFLQVMLSIWESVLVQGSTLIADENTKIQDHKGRLLLSAVNTV